MLASVLVPALIGCLVWTFLGQVKTGILHDATTNVFVAIVAGFTAALLVSTFRNHRIKLSDRLIERLAERVRPDGGLDADQAPFRQKDPRWLDDGKSRQYENLDQPSKKAVRWMAVVWQASNPPYSQHTIDCLREQIDALETKIADLKMESARAGEPSQVPAVEWVCFVSKTGKFGAFQDYRIFRYQIRQKRNASYLALLNAVTEDEFTKAIEDNITRSDPQTDENVPPQYYSDAIPGLQKFSIEKGKTNEDALKDMAAGNKIRAMLISNTEAAEPRGVITLKELAERMLFEPLRNYRPQSKLDVTDK